MGPAPKFQAGSQSQIIGSLELQELQTKPGKLQGSPLSTEFRQEAKVMEVHL